MEFGSEPIDAPKLSVNPWTTGAAAAEGGRFVEWSKKANDEMRELMAEFEGFKHAAACE